MYRNAGAVIRHASFLSWALFLLCAGAPCQMYVLVNSLEKAQLVTHKLNIVQRGIRTFNGLEKNDHQTLN